jgi:uncharacterized membrane protein
MSDLVFIAFPSEAKAEEVRAKVLDMQKDYLIEIGDAVIAAKDANGHVKLNQLFNTTAAGAAGGAFWGLLVGMIFLMPIAGVALGAASGALGGSLTDFGIDDNKMKEAAQALQPGEAGLFLLIRKHLLRSRQGRGVEGCARAACRGVIKAVAPAKAGVETWPALRELHSSTGS